MSKEMEIIHVCKNALVDDFAELVTMINDGNLVQAAVYAEQMSIGMGLFADLLASQALVQLLEDKFGKSTEE